MALGSRPTRRRGRWLLLGVVATVVVLAVNAAMSARSPAPARQLAEQSYLDGVVPIIQDSTRQGQDLATVRSQALTLGAATVGDRLQDVVSRADHSLVQLRRLAPPASLQDGHDLLVASVALRAQGATAFQQAMAGALSGRSSAAPVQQVVDVGRDLDAGDRAFALFLAAMPRLDVPLPQSVWLSDPSSYDQQDVSVFLTSLRSAASLAPVHDTSVLVVTTNPLPVGLSGTTEVLPVARTLDLQVVVADLGNQAEKHLTVTAMLSPVAGGESQSVRNFVDLTPGQRRTVDLGGLRPAAGVPTVLTVTIDTVLGEATTADNAKVLSFVMQGG